jgi:hypothetical protein
MLAPEDLEGGVVEDIAYEIIIGLDGGRARLLIEQRDLAEYRARGKRDEPGFAPIARQPETLALPLAMM